MDNEQSLLYRYQEKTPLSVTGLAGLQWFIVTFSSSLVVPLVIAETFQLSAQQTGEFVQLTFFWVGIASLLQVLFGHRLPIIEGPAGMWWGIFIILGQLGISLGKTPAEIGRNLEFGLISAGILLALIGLLGWVEHLKKIFTPLVTGTYLVLLAISLSGSFLKGMLGIGYFHDGVHPGIALVSLFLAAFTLVLVFTPWKWAQSYAMIIGITLGWIIFGLLGWAGESATESVPVMDLPVLFFWGMPEFDPGVTITSVLTGFILLTNLVASIVVMGKAARITPDTSMYNRGGTFTGVAHMLSGMGGIVGLVPLSIAAGIVEVTRIASRAPFILASILMIAMGFFPVIGGFLSGLPAPVGYAVLFISFTQLLGFGFKDLSTVAWNKTSVMIAGSAIMLGSGLMFVPSSALTELPQLVGFLIGNGLMMGVLVCIFLEQVVFRQQRSANNRVE
ncbi:MAG: purine/pyrimidine permease [Bacillaceae bacterium]|nr:purine/pyrimidine permease [Bacillaceae bacterium]